MVMVLYCPGEQAREKRRPRKLRNLADPRFLETVFDDPLKRLAAAVVITAGIVQPTEGRGDGQVKRAEKRDTAFLRSKWCETILDALDLDVDRWKQILREGPASK